MTFDKNASNTDTGSTPAATVINLTDIMADSDDLDLAASDNEEQIENETVRNIVMGTEIIG